MKKNIQEISHQNIRWINITKPNKENSKYLQKEFNFNALDLEDVLASTQRSKVDKYENYTFMILLFPVYNRKTQSIESSEVDVFLGKDFLVTIHRGNLPPLVDLFELCQSSTQACEQAFRGSSELLLYSLLKKLFLYTYPMLDHVSLDIADIEKKIFKGQERQMTKTIMSTRHNVIDMRKIMQAHKNTLIKLKKDHKEEGLYAVDRKHFDYYDDIIDYTKEIWDQLENFKEAIETVQSTNESLISFRLNDVMKILTIFSVLFLPPTLVGTIFGMNAKMMPFVDHPLGFYAMLGISGISTLIFLVFIWKKRWL